MVSVSLLLLAILNFALASEPSHDLEIQNPGNNGENLQENESTQHESMAPCTSTWILIALIAISASFILKKLMCDWMPKFVEDWIHERSSPNGNLTDYFYLQQVYERQERREEELRIKRNCPIKKRLRLIEQLRECATIVTEESLVVNNTDGGHMIHLPRGDVSNMCAVCLCEFELGETLLWSSNESCQHCFHHDCILTWLVKIKEEEGTTCPCCRQEFISTKCSKDLATISTRGSLTASDSADTDESIQLELAIVESTLSTAEQHSQVTRTHSRNTRRSYAALASDEDEVNLQIPETRKQASALQVV